MRKYFQVLSLVLICNLTIHTTIGKPKYPLRFIENGGQMDESILYYAQVPGGQIYLRKEGIEFLFVDYGNRITNHAHSANPDKDPDPSHRQSNVIATPDDIKGHRYKVYFQNASSEVSVMSGDPGSERYNYFTGKDPSKWASGVMSFGQITYSDIYEGIDMDIYSTNEGIKYDFIIHPDADPNDIRLQYVGLSDLQLKQGNLYLKTSMGDLIEENPIAFQDGQKVSCNYRLDGNSLSFDFPENYNSSQKLTIDPLLIFSTYSGSAADNWGNTATFDAFGNLYSGGMTNEIRGEEFLGVFNATPGAFQTSYGGIWDVAILKYDSTGSQLLYATYLGGSNSEVPQSLIVNSKGELVILGITSSDDFPITENAYDKNFSGGSSFGLFGGSGVQYSNGSDIFISKLSADGSELISSTYLGGSGNDGIISTNSGPNLLVRNYGDHSRGDVIIDSNDNILIASRTNSRDMSFQNALRPEHGGGDVDGIIVKMSDDLSSMIWGTYFGGSGEDAALSIKLTNDDEVYFAGGTNSLDFPTTRNSLHPVPTGVSDMDGFVAYISADGQQLLASSYIGTTDYDQVYQMDLDTDGDVYVVGQTRGPYPFTEGPRVDANSGQFVHKLTAELDSTLFSTVFGSGRDEPDIYITAFLVNDCNNLYISGWGSPILTDRGIDFMQLTTSGLQTTSEAHQRTSDGSSFYLAVYTDDMSELLYATHLGTGSSLVHVDGGTSRFDKQGIVYHAVCASCAPDDSTFPTTPGAWSEDNGSSGCNNAAFKFDLASLNARVRTNSASLDQPNIVQGCAPFEVAFENISVGGEIYEWEFGDNQDTISFVRDTIYHTYEIPGTYNIRLRATDSSTCAEEDEDFTTITVFSTNFQVSESTLICGGSFAQLSASGAVQYDWRPKSSLINSETPFPKAIPDTTTNYFVTLIDQNGCVHEDSLTVEVIPEIKVDIGFSYVDKCEGVANLDISNLSENVESILWDFGNGTNSTEFEPKILFDEPGEYRILASLFNQGCIKEFSLPVVMDELFVPNIITPNGDGINDLFKISSYLPIRVGIYNRYGKELYSSDAYDDGWDGGVLASGVYYYELTFPDSETCSGWVQVLR